MKPREPIRVLIVDDSAVVRKLLTSALKEAAQILVVGAARDGNEAIEMAGRLKPNVITLDVQMPGRSGLEILPDLLAACDASVIMVSAFTKEGADVTLAALELGAIDFLAKPDARQFNELRQVGELLLPKIEAAASARRPGVAVRNLPPVSPTPTPVPRRRPPAREVDTGLETPEAATACVAIGISTGGPQALGRTLPLLTPPVPPILIVQHMPEQFTDVFAQRLNRTCSIPVKEAEEGDKILPDRILIAPGDRHMVVVGRATRARVSLSDGPKVSGHRPSVDVLFTTAARAYGSHAVGIIMTGMGRDGVEGCKAILEAGGSTFGQDEMSSAVYGMNKAAYLEGAVGSQFALEKLPSLIKKFSPAC